MDKRTKELYQSLVGASTEFSFKKKLSNPLSLEKNIEAAQRKISRDVKTALSVGGKLCIMMLAEITNHYRNEPYYMAVRSYIEMRRYRPTVLEYLSKEVEERADEIRSILSESIKGDKNRELKVGILEHFIAVYPSRLSMFKSLITRSEYLQVV